MRKLSIFSSYLILDFVLYLIERFCSIINGKLLMVAGSFHYYNLFNTISTLNYCITLNTMNRKIKMTSLSGKMFLWEIAWSRSKIFFVLPNIFFWLVWLTNFFSVLVREITRILALLGIEYFFQSILIDY